MVNRDILTEKRVYEILNEFRYGIFNFWLDLIITNSKLKQGSYISEQLPLYKSVLDNYIDYFQLGDLTAFTVRTKRIALNVSKSNISYSRFITNLQYFQESYIQTLLSHFQTDGVYECITHSNRVYHKMVNDIRKEYFNLKDSTLSACVKLSELRDDITGYHNERTKDYAVLLSKKMDFNNDFIDDMKKASLLHDIGKVGIKDSILLKPDKLTSSEFDEIKKHTLIGAQTILKVLNEDTLMHDYLYMAIDIALHHHEKYNGSGYPNGLSGNQIPISARIFALADAYDVITSKRPYKEALSHEEAVNIIVADSGKHFDPDIVKIFTTYEDRFSNIRRKYIN